MRSGLSYCGQYIWQSAVTVGAPDLLLGKAVVTDMNVAASGVNSRVVMYGDFSRYRVRVVNGVRFETSDQFKFDTDEIAYRTLVRVDGKLEVSGAIVAIVSAA